MALYHRCGSRFWLLVALAVGLGLILALGGCSGGGLFARFTDALTGGGSGDENPSLTDRFLGTPGAGGNALAYLGAVGGISCLGGIVAMCITRGQQGMRPILLGTGLIILNYAILEFFRPLFWLAVILTGIASIVIGYRAISGASNGSGLIRAVRDRFGGGAELADMGEDRAGDSVNGNRGGAGVAGAGSGVVGAGPRNKEEVDNA